MSGYDGLASTSSGPEIAPLFSPAPFSGAQVRGGPVLLFMACPIGVAHKSAVLGEAGVLPLGSSSLATLRLSGRAARRAFVLPRPRSNHLSILEPTRRYFRIILGGLSLPGRRPTPIGPGLSIVHSSHAYRKR